MTHIWVMAALLLSCVDLSTAIMPRYAAESTRKPGEWSAGQDRKTCSKSAYSHYRQSAKDGVKWWSPRMLSADTGGACCTDGQGLAKIIYAVNNLAASAGDPHREKKLPPVISCLNAKTKDPGRR
jgi:hypothetical protein